MWGGRDTGYMSVGVPVLGLCDRISLLYSDSIHTFLVSYSSRVLVQ